MLPEIFTVPVDIDILEYLSSLFVTAIEIDAADKVPAPTASTLSAPEPVPAFIVIAPETINEFVPLIVTV
ncbi:hypothetical protein, partial [Flavobacterium sp.]|uniref:hypothetical protein n=1 Tax=Flavobacterium sp. TaxID=239 RepID=UPI002609E075